MAAIVILRGLWQPNFSRSVQIGGGLLLYVNENNKICFSV